MSTKPHSISFVVAQDAKAWVLRLSLQTKDIYAWFPVEVGTTVSEIHLGHDGDSVVPPDQIENVYSQHRSVHLAKGNKPFRLHTKYESTSDPTLTIVQFTLANSPPIPSFQALFSQGGPIHVGTWPIFLCSECRTGRNVSDHPPGRDFAKNVILTPELFHGAYDIDLSCYIVAPDKAEQWIEQNSGFEASGAKLGWTIKSPEAALAIVPTPCFEPPLLQTIREHHGWCPHHTYP